MAHSDDRWDQLSESLGTLGLTRGIFARPVDDTQAELLVVSPINKEFNDGNLVNISDVGLGVSQVLPVLVALLVAQPGQLVYIEQPEIHLHPKAQVALAKVLADAAKRGVRVVAETHSALLLLGIQTLVAKGELDKDLVKLHWFSLQEDGTSKVSSHDLDETGAYGEWPEDFGDVELNAQSAYLDAVDSQELVK
jgi:predicted ATPase